MNIVLCASYGLLAACTYLCLGKTGIPPVQALPIIAGAGCVILSMGLSVQEIMSELRRMNWIRPVLFASSQMLIAVALAENSALSTFYSGAAGTVVAILGGSILCGERPSGRGVVGVGLVFAGVLLVQSESPLTAVALVAGALQGMTVVLTRDRSVRGAKPRVMAAASMATLFVASSAWTIFRPFPGDYSGVATFQLGAAILGFSGLQYMYCYMSGRFPSWILSTVMHLRIPFGLLVGVALLRESLTIAGCASAILVCSGVFALFYRRGASGVVEKDVLEAA